MRLKNTQNAGNKGNFPHWQWEAVGPNNETFFMLNTDFELIFDLSLDSQGKSSCRIDVSCIKKNTCGKKGSCAKAKTYGLTKQYVEVSLSYLKNITRWLRR